MYLNYFPLNKPLTPPVAVGLAMVPVVKMVFTPGRTWRCAPPHQFLLLLNQLAGRVRGKLFLFSHQKRQLFHLLHCQKWSQINSRVSRSVSIASLSLGQNSSTTSIRSFRISSKAWHLHSSNVTWSASAATVSAASFMHVSESSSPNIQAGIAFMARLSHCSISTSLESSARHPPSLIALLMTTNLSNMVSQAASAGFGSSQQESQGTSSSGSSVASQPGRRSPGGATYLPKVAGTTVVRTTR